MSSIIDNTSAMNHAHHTCGGTILSGSDHVYCDRCGAAAYYGDDMDVTTWEDAMEAVHAMGDGEDNL